MTTTKRIGYLKKDVQERVRNYPLGNGKNRTRAWLVNAWRIVDATGRDLVQPWSNTKGEARETAKALNIELVEKKNE